MGSRSRHGGNQNSATANRYDELRRVHSWRCHWLLPSYLLTLACGVPMKLNVAEDTESATLREELAARAMDTEAPGLFRSFVAAQK